MKALKALAYRFKERMVNYATSRGVVDLKAIGVEPIQLTPEGTQVTGDELGYDHYPALNEHDKIVGRDGRALLPPLSVIERATGDVVDSPFSDRTTDLEYLQRMSSIHAAVEPSDKPVDMAEVMERVEEFVRGNPAPEYMGVPMEQTGKDFTKETSALVGSIGGAQLDSRMRQVHDDLVVDRSVLGGSESRRLAHEKAVVKQIDVINACIKRLVHVADYVSEVSKVHTWNILIDLVDAWGAKTHSRGMRIVQSELRDSLMATIAVEGMLVYAMFNEELAPLEEERFNLFVVEFENVIREGSSEKSHQDPDNLSYGLVMVMSDEDTGQYPEMPVMGGGLLEALEEDYHQQQRAEKRSDSLNTYLERTTDLVVPKGMIVDQKGNLRTAPVRSGGEAEVSNALDALLLQPLDWDKSQDKSELTDSHGHPGHSELGSLAWAWRSDAKASGKEHFVKHQAFFRQVGVLIENNDWEALENLEKSGVVIGRDAGKHTATVVTEGVRVTIDLDKIHE